MPHKLKRVENKTHPQIKIEKTYEWLSSYSLTPRENDVAHILIETELPIKAIAAELKISERSVYRYASSIYEKTGIDNRADLVKQYLILDH